MAPKTKTIKKDKNIFSKTYNFFETKYSSFSDWLSDKGIPINKLNDFLESKGIPAFVFMICLLLIIIAVILLLTIRTTETTVQFTIRDDSGGVVDNVSLTIKDNRNKQTVFEGTVTSGESMPLPLKIGREYSFGFSKTGFSDQMVTKIIESQKETISITLKEDLEKGNLIIRSVDSETEKIITKARATARFVEGGETKVLENNQDENNEITLHIPIGKRTSITIEADGYQTKTFDITLESLNQTHIEYLNYDGVEFSGAPAKLTIIVNDKQQNPLDGARVELYDNNNQLLGVGDTILGRITFDVVTGKIIRFVVTKEEYRSYDSDKEEKTFRITEKDQQQFVTLELGGKSLSLTVLDSANKLPLENVQVKIFNEKNNLVNSEITNMAGQIKIDGLDVNENYAVTACLEKYLCSQEIINIYEKNIFEILLNKQTGDNSARLSVWIYNEFGDPISQGKISLYRQIGERFVPSGYDAQSVDITGYTSFNTKIEETYKIVGNFGELSQTETITIEAYKDNKVILFIEDAKRIIDLKLIDEDGRDIIEGELSVKTKDGYVLFNKNLDGTSNEFDVLGYREIIVEYTDTNGNKTTLVEQVGEEKEQLINIDKKKAVVGNYPIVDFVGVENVHGHRTSFVTPNKDYYLIFNVVFPENAKRGGVHIRAGTDEQKDADNMVYGVTGFRANTTNFIYSKTYTKDPAPGVSSIDYLNTGRDGEINKWLELEWQDQEDLGQHQFRVKINTTDINPNKLEFRYRAWVQDSGLFYRDPKDESLELQQTTNEKQALYANTKNLFIDVFETPADCQDDFCISYKFLDEDFISYETSEFFGIEDKLYALEINLYSFRNTEINLLAKTSTTSPIISFVEIEERAIFPQNINVDFINELELSKQSISLTAGLQKKIYVFFVTKNIGSAFIDVITTGSTISSTEERFSFNVSPEKEMIVEMIPELVLTRGNPLTINVKDKETNQPIENAFIKITNEYKEFITSLKGDRLNGRGGSYTFSQNINVNKIIIEISAYGYKPITRELIVGEDGVVFGPDQVNINVGENQSQARTTISLRNTDRNTIENIRTEVNFIMPVSTMNIEVHHEDYIFSQTSSNVDIIVNVNQEVNFRKAKAIVIVSGFIGNKHVVKPIEVIVTKGKIISDCLEIKPKLLSLSVGLQEDAEIRQDVYFTNNCEQPVTLTPEIIPLSTRKDEDLEILINQITILAGEQREHEILIKNTKNRTRGNTQKYEINWNNDLYVLENTKLDVSFFDIRNILKVYPGPIIPLTMSQPVGQEPGILYTGFILKNEGQVPIRDIVISEMPAGLTANLKIEIQPITIDLIKPGETLQVNVKYESKTRFATIDDVIYNIRGYGPGIGSTVSTQLTNVFLISPPDCLQVMPKMLNYSMELGKSLERVVTLKNTCAEPITVNDIDKRDQLYIQTFGNNELTFFPQTTSRLNIGQSASFTFKLTASDYHTAYSTPLRILARTDTGNLIASEQINVTVDIMPKDEKQAEDIRQLQQRTMTVCGTDDRVIVSYPLITDSCLSQGYCDATAAAKTFLDQINSLHSNIINVSKQLNNKLDQTGCYITGGNIRSCDISSIHPDLQPLEFDLYLQNDVVSKELVQELLNLDRSASSSKYSRINNYLVVDSPSIKPTDVSFVGNRIFFPGEILGCGRYRIKIDASVAVTNTDLQPERAYFFVEIDEIERTDACEKNIQNYQIFLPLNRDLMSNKTLNTWLTRFSGHREIASKVADNLFKEDPYRYTQDPSLTTNNLYMHFDNISEKEDALAKIIFGDRITATKPKPERVDIILNNNHLIGDNVPEIFVTKATSIINNLIVQRQHVDLCISPDYDYMLVLDFIEIDDLMFDFKDRNPNLKISDGKECKEFLVKSSIGEEINFRISSEVEEFIDIKYKYEGSETEKLRLVLEKDKEKSFEVCVEPKADSFLGNLVGKKVNVFADSRYVIKGSEGKRAVERQINLESCGITPVKLIEEINKKAEYLKRDNTPKEGEYISLVTWDSRYNNSNQETFCQTLKKYYDTKGYDGELFFSDAESICPDIIRPDQLKEARTTRIVNNGLVYFKDCSIWCTGCSLGLDVASIILTGGLASGKLLATGVKDLLSCALGCLIPAATYAVTEEYSDWDNIFTKLGSQIAGTAIGARIVGAFPAISTGGGLIGIVNSVLKKSAETTVTSDLSGLQQVLGSVGGTKPSLEGITSVDDYVSVLNNDITKHAKLATDTSLSSAQRAGHKGVVTRYERLRESITNQPSTKSTPTTSTVPKTTTSTKIQKGLNIAKIGCHVLGNIQGSNAFKKSAGREALEGSIKINNPNELLFDNNTVYLVEITYDDAEETTQGAHHVISITPYNNEEKELVRLDNCLYEEK